MEDRADAGVGQQHRQRQRRRETNISFQRCLTVVMRTELILRSFCMPIQHVCKLYNKFCMLTFNYFLGISSGKGRKNNLSTTIFPQKAESEKN